MVKRPPRLSEVSETNRLEAFSDGMFAIAMTLLILEIRLPSDTDFGQAGTLIKKLLDLWPAYLSYVTSFVTIGIMWVNHHGLFQRIRRTDRTLLILNMLLLMVITFFNFPTVVMAQYFQQADGPIAAMLYSGTLLVIGILFNLMWWYASNKPDFMDSALQPDALRRLSIRYGLGLSLYVVAFVIAPFSVTLSVLLCLGLAIYFMVPAL